VRKLIASAFLSVLFVLPVSADQWNEVVAKAQKAVLYLETGDGSCTAFVINTTKKYAMSAAHCYSEKDSMWVDRVQASVVALDTKKDLLVIKIDELDPSKEELKLAAKDPEIRQDVMSVGFGYGLERPFFKTAHVSDTAVMIPQSGIGGPFIGVDAAYTGGQSGGPVLDVNGDIVSIVQRSDGGTLGIGVGADIIRERMGRFFSKK
jgi:S1-C subfamily serine protease